MVYNVGSRDLPLGEIGTKVNDNTYHIVRFQRFGGNATLQLDDYNVQTVHPQGKIRYYNSKKFSSANLTVHHLCTQDINQPFSIQCQTFKLAVKSLEMVVSVSNVRSLVLYPVCL